MPPEAQAPNGLERGDLIYNSTLCSMAVDWSKWGNPKLDLIRYYVLP